MQTVYARVAARVGALADRDYDKAWMVRQVNIISQMPATQT
eukprot:CAMPEP_0119334218 /NCGR_PEP_ID=MMETSP1333-20130426/86839_1 /TAXON_ID=418940 /ORGANISM="Scyphosphaera apsteinii, Strain RCC1455" /LENGTH=40 /DNA_ID= /DNA_START= /DNA_END= /DNA_ORIENTATION=